MMIKKISIFIGGILLICQSSKAYDFKVDGIYYQYNAKDITVSVTFGDNYYQTPGQDPYYDTYKGSISVPSEITYNGRILPVKGIADRAFYNCNNLSSISLPNTITSIGSSAFEGCTNLSSISLPTTITSIGSNAFKDCVSLCSIAIPDNVSVIENCTFYGCTHLSSISLPNTMTSIGSSAFEGCTSLSQIDLPNSIKSIETKAFYNSGLLSLSLLRLPYSYHEPLYIHESAFDNCSELVSAEICGSLEGNFRNCIKLEKVSFGTINRIGYDSFKGSKNISHIIYYAQPWRLPSSRNSWFDAFDSLSISQIEIYSDFISEINTKSIDTLTIGGLCSRISLSDSVWNKLKAICLKYPIPIPKVDITIPNNVYINVPCYVPKNHSAIYAASEKWRPFFNIIEAEMDNINGLQKKDIGSVSDFIDLDDRQVFVMGYIIGSCSTNIEHADFEAPFELSSAILLADNSEERDTDKMISIGMKSGSNFRKDVNLKDHPENKGRLLCVYGYKVKYLGISGIKDVGYYFLLESENGALTNIELPFSEKKNPIQYYNIVGEKLNTLQKGINIVRYTNGEVKKILKK